LLKQLGEQSFEFLYEFSQSDGCVFDLVCVASDHFCVASWLLWVVTLLDDVVVCIGVFWLCVLCDVSVCIRFFKYVVVVFAASVVCGVITSA